MGSESGPLPLEMHCPHVLQMGQPMTSVHLLFLPGHWDRAHVRSPNAWIHTRCWDWMWVGRSMDPFPGILMPHVGFVPPESLAATSPK